MSGTHPDKPAAPAAGGDPSMEDILASIRRILSEDEPAADAAAATTDVVHHEAPATVAAIPAPKPADDVLALDASMIVEQPRAAARPADASALMAPETEAAVASSVGGLLRTLIAERDTVAVYRGGPTIEDLVREEIRPLLKHWLDTNLQALVERHVRAEIERVVGRAVS